MGLDGVELLIAVEESFAIRIENEEAEQAQTVGALHELVMSKLQPARSQDCLSSHAFYRLRAALQDRLGLSRNQVVPKAEMESLVPHLNRRAQWGSIASSLGMKLPDLCRPVWFAIGASILLLGMSLFAIVGGLLGYVPSLEAWCLGLGVIPGYWLGERLSAPLATHFPSDCLTAGSTAQSILHMNFEKLSSECASWTPDEVMETLRTIIVEHLAVTPEQVVPHATFVEDLGVY